MQTKLIAGLLASVITAVTVLPISAASADSADITHLTKTLLTSGTAAEADDFNGDGVINAVDLTLMKRALLSEADSGEQTAQSVTDIAENTKLIGRNLTADGVTWLPQSGSAVECTVTATEASVTIAGDSCVYSDEKYRPRYGVYVDGELIQDVVMDEPEQTVKLFSGETQRTATVRIMHLSEANNGAIGVKKFDVISSAAKPVKPTAKKDLKIEFIGDSITCAYGVGADSQYVNFSTATEDFSKSYAYLTAQLLDADYSAVCYSGHGIVSGYSDDGDINTDALVPPVYENIAKLDDYAVPWDFASDPSDVVFINLGTNDDSYASKDLETRGKEYQDAYVAFLKQIRKCNPDAAIVCTVGIMDAQELYPYIEAAVKESGDARAFCYESPIHNIAAVSEGGDGIGADWHPSAITHEKNSYLAASEICKALGIPYSGVGLDMAAHGEYGVDLDDTNGANAWPYYAEWNQSLNVNITKGGASPNEIIAYIRNIDLSAGEYELSATVKGADGLEIPYVLRNMHDSSKVYASGTMTDEKITVPVTMDTADAECEIVFLLGNVGSANVTFSGITLYKRA